MRLFTAIELPDDAREHLGALIRRLRSAGGRGFRLVKIDNLHVTLKFLGDVTEDRAAEVSRALEGVMAADPTGPLFADRAELLPPRGKVRVIAAGLGGDGGPSFGCFVRSKTVAPGSDSRRRIVPTAPT